jgi:hypothetical protein
VGVIGISAAKISGCRPVWQFPATAILLKSAAVCFVKVAIAILIQLDGPRDRTAGYCRWSRRFAD